MKTAKQGISNAAILNRLPFLHLLTAMVIIQIRGFAPIGKMECWNIEKMGL
jgi:hypothetical protein